MKPLPALLPAAAVALALLGPALAAQDADPEPPLFIVGTTILDVVEGRLEPFRTVRIDGGLVTEVGSAAALTPTEGARVIEARGAVLVPGLAEMHGHLPNPAQGRAFAEDVMFLYLANGITTVRGMLGDPQQLQLRAEVAEGELDGPRLVVGSPPMHGGATKTAEAARDQVAAYAEAGYEHLKVHEGLKPEVYDAICAAASDAELRWGGHVSDFVGLDVALERGQATIDHLDNILESALPEATLASYGSGIPPIIVADLVERDRLPAVAKRIRAAGSAVVPTMVLFDTIYSGRSGDEVRAERPEVKYMPRATVDVWEKQVDQTTQGLPEGVGPRIAAHRRAALTVLHEAGVELLMGTDSPQIFSVPGFSLRRECELMVECGMTPLEVIRTGTINVHRYLGEPTPFGCAPGARADFLLVRGNPLEDVGTLFDLEAIVFGGRTLTRAEIDARLEAIAAKQN